MKTLEFLTNHNYIVTTREVFLDDLIDGWGIDVFYDPNDSRNNRINLTCENAIVKLSDKKEEQLFDYLHELWKQEIRNWEDAYEAKEEFDNRRLHYEL